MTTRNNGPKDGPDLSSDQTGSPRTDSGQDLRRIGEALAREQADWTLEDIASFSPEKIRETLHELRVHQIELGMQNKELRRAHAEIEASQACYFDLYDLAPVGYITVSEKGLILEINLTAAALLNTARSALVKKPISGFILKQDQDIYYLHRKKIFETGETQECELRMLKPDGAHFWVHMTATAARAEDGGPVCRVAISDITGRKQAEAEKEQLISELQDALAEVKKLSGLLPICMYCKKIRDDQGYWNQIESYIHEHSDVEFSHSICKECAEHYYPDIDLYDD